jgi:hypothetical protein
MDGMKRLLFILCLLPCLVTASSHKRLDSILSASYTLAGISVAGNAQMPDSVAIPYVNLAIQEVSTQYSAVIKFDSAVLSATDPRVAVDSTYEELLWCRIRRNVLSAVAPSAFSFLKVVPEDSVYEYTQQAKAEVPKDQSIPSYVWVSASYLHIHPEPIYADSIYYVYVANGAKLASASDVTDVLPKYRKLIVLLTAKYICLDMGKFEKATLLESDIERERIRLR